MKIETKSPKQALNKTYRKQAVSENDLLSFKQNLQSYIANIKSAEKLKQTEGGMGDSMLGFLKGNLPNYHISKKSIKGQHEIDLAIWNGNKASGEIGVIIEQKRPGERDMISADNANTKAMHEAVTYFLHERLHKEQPNPNVRQVIITDFYQWFIFDASDFFKAFNNGGLIKNFKNWREGKTSDTSTNGIYNIIKNYIDSNELNLSATYVNLLDYDKDSKKSEDDFIRLYKLFSDINLLKKPFDNDANSLNKKFYDELLYLIGLEEVKVKNKKLIQRLSAEKRQNGSLLENAIRKIQAKNKLARVDNLSQYGNTQEDQLFNVGLELCISWINRILFLKLLEGQLLRYHQGHTQYAFLHPTKIKEFDDLDTLFFEVLAHHPHNRNDLVRERYQHIPYLNSSLFEESELEQQTISIANLNDNITLPLIGKNSVLRKSQPPTDALNYLLRFLNAYDFGLEGKENKLAGQNRPLINASVLGLIFEKINGYKEGSFYTPSFITMYMCRQTIRRAVCDKLGALYGQAFEEFAELRRYMDRNVRKTDELERAEKVIDSLTICDPAVGSGHFLVSALNELIATKAELGLLLDEDKQPLRIEVSVQNDELIVEDRHGDFFEYLPTIGEVPAAMHNIQKTLFRQKQRLIENCLFGVDINPNSVKICRLRLWIELLKHTYYMDADDDGTRAEDAFMYLKTLPNIDINIKCGNSLISRFGLDSDLSEALKDTKYSIEAYQSMISTYHGVKDAQSKKAIERALLEIKETFKGEIDKRDPRLAKIKTRQAKLFKLGGLKHGGGLFDAMEGVSKGEKQKRKNLIKKLGQEIGDLEASIEADKNAVIYNNAFEWRYEFPKVLDADGSFVGFDVVIGNPPYIKEYEGKAIFNGLRNWDTYQGKCDIWYIFTSLGINLCREKGFISFIAQNNWTTSFGARNLRNKVISSCSIIELFDFKSNMVFDEASIQTMLMFFKKDASSNFNILIRNVNNRISLKSISLLDSLLIETFNCNVENKQNLLNQNLIFNVASIQNVIDKINNAKSFELDGKSEIAQGIVCPQEKVNKKSLETLGSNHTLNEGVFILTNNELNNIGLSKAELKIVKPLYTSKELAKYSKIDSNKEWVIYTDLETSKQIDNYPTIKTHLTKYESIMTSDNKPFGLHRARNEVFFTNEKILSLRKCSEPTFTYVDEDSYVTQSYYSIKTSRIPLKYLTGIFNSKTSKFWFQNFGKMQGQIFQIDKSPLLNFPIAKGTASQQELIEGLVNQILNLKKVNPQADTQALENKIDLQVYKLYGLTHEEVLIVDPDFGMSEGEYLDHPV